MKCLRFVELSHETEVLNMVTEIMGLSSQIPKPTKPYAGERFTLHSKRNVYAYVCSISAILCSGVVRNIREPRQSAARFAAKILIIIFMNCAAAVSALAFVDR